MIYRKSGISSSTIIAIVAPIAVTAVLFIVGFCFLRRKAKKKYNAVPESNADNDLTTLESLQFDFETIEVATNKFSTDNKLGAGGFGEVYKGVLPSGQEIAVKRLSKASGQGAEEFKNEVVLVAKLQHRNLAWKQWRDGTPLQLLDTNLTDSYSRNEVIRCIQLGLLCVQEDPAERPSMATIVLMLNSYSVTLPLPQQPAFFIGSRTERGLPTKEFECSDKSTSKSIPWSVDEASITEVYPR
ncbi:hypothetical protein CUMW_010310 [Citrus unshiu]|nr:hypothetical protein CUMW_010310 [Citrus unshiu]